MTDRVVCVDVGSTYTKAALVDLGSGELLGTASARTTADTDVMDGYDVCRAALGVAADVPALACSSAGGGLRLAVVGYEREITAEAGHRVGLSAGARVVHVAAGEMSAADVEALAAARPDVVLLVGGTDGGNAQTLLHNAGVIATSGLRVPVVVAGNVDARDHVGQTLAAGHSPVVLTDNVLPEIGRIDPRPARTAIRNVFVRHVIGGKHLSHRADFPAMVRAATPDAVLAGVELLADGVGDDGAGDVLVVDVGGATTDVYSVVTPVGEDAALRKTAVEVLWRSRTVEGDLGMRWNAAGVVDAAVAERLLALGEEEEGLRKAAAVRAADPAYLSVDEADAAADVRLAELAVTVALRRHARGGSDGRTSGAAGAGKDLRQVALVVGSGGVLRHASPAAQARILAPATTDLAGGWPLPRSARTMIDTSYVLAAAGLLAAEHPVAAARLLARHLRA